MKSKSNWVLVTAGLGEQNFQDAAERVVSQAKGLKMFSECLVLSDVNVEKNAFQITDRYPGLFSSSNWGYGYMTYKPAALLNLMDGTFGKFSGAVWVDAGCEIYPSYLNLIRFRYFILIAKRRGIACFTLDTPEYQYTKRELFDFFEVPDPISYGSQIQATWFLVYGEKGKRIMREWLECILENEEKFNFDVSSDEYSDFIQHRNDQSIFSMVCKRNNIIPMRLKPTPGCGSWRTLLRGFFHPIWTSRNRSGVTTIPRIYRFFALK
jgi:hypothetical protein